MSNTILRITAALAVAGSCIGLVEPVSAGTFEGFDPTLTYGSVEAIPNPAVVDTEPLRTTSLAAREAFVQRVLECGYVDRVLDVLTANDAVTTLDDTDTSFAVGAGGFAGESTASIVYTVEDDGPGAASDADIDVLTNSLGYVFSQGSAFLLDADDPTSFDFPANYAVLLFDETPPIEASAALFETVGAIDPELFATDTSGYTQYGPAYVTLQSAVPDEQFITGYVAAAAASGVEYTPVVDGTPGLYTGGAAFPANDWAAQPQGESYLARIPAPSHDELSAIRDAHLELIDRAQRIVTHAGGPRRGDARVIRSLSHLPCGLSGHRIGTHEAHPAASGVLDGETGSHGDRLPRTR